MNNKAIYVSLFVGAILLLVVLYNFSQKHEGTRKDTRIDTPTQVTNTTGPNKIISGASGSTVSNSGRVSQIPSSEQKKIIEGMMNSPNLTVCDKETTEAAKAQCEDRIFFMRATLQKNPTACSTIKSPETLGTCVAGSIKILSGTVLEDPCTQLTNPLSKQSCSIAYVTIQAQLKNDILLCGSIQDSSKQTMCKNGVIIAQAISKKDPKICAQITDASMQKNCMSAVK